MKYCIFFLFGFLSTFLFSQSEFSVSGYLTEELTGEPLIGAQITALLQKRTIQTNEFGFYSMTLNEGNQLLCFSASGLKTDTISLFLNGNKTINRSLKQDATEIGIVEVSAKRDDNFNSTKIGELQVDMELAKKLPAFMGEVDIIKTLQLMPGVSSVSEGGQGFYVRGGGPDQNLVLLDNAQVYNASHLFGFFSVFNADAVKSVNLIKGSIPANYGGRLSSVLEVNMNEGNNKRFKVTGGLGLISSRLTIEGPIVKDKASFIVSLRRTYLDVFMKAFTKPTSAFAGTTYYFYDFNGKINYRLSQKDKLYLSAYYGKDLFNFGNQKDDFSVRMPWGNGIVAARWAHQFSDKWFMNTTLSMTDYLFSFGSQQDQFRFELKSGIRDYGAKTELSYYSGKRHTVKFGADYLFHTFTPTSVSASQAETVFDTGIAQKLYSHESGVFIQDELDLNEFIRVNAGFRYSMYQFVGPFTRFVKGNIANPDSSINYKSGEVIQFYQGFEPRISARFLLKNQSSIKAGFTVNNQYVHLASLSAVSLPTDIWYPTTDIAQPQRGWQASAGYFKNFNKNKWETSFEVYYKHMKNVIDYKQGALPADNVSDNPDNLLVFGTGWSYGAELFIKRTFGKLTGWIGYTWAKTDRLFPDLQAEVFPAKYDRRHDATVVATYELNKHWTFGLAFIYASGNTLTLPSSWYTQDQDILFNYGLKNSTRMAAYHRFDVSATWYDKPTKKVTNSETGEIEELPKKFRQNVNFSVYNIYNRANPYFLYIDNDGSLLENDFKISVKQVSLFPIIPSITWNFAF